MTLKEVPLEDLVLLGSPVLPGRGVDTVLESKRGGSGDTGQPTDSHAG